MFVVPSLEELLDSVLDSKPWASPLEIGLVICVIGLREMEGWYYFGNRERSNIF